ncbi:LOW QUALITY PROTEIN: putative cancer susceptibility gene HEPN1 protein [Artibeus jamaicensis]|uniref:LOW QUALITY PROTEIN: putative cancer susceptibility gene HEPN1 protein n=1 Tax=Artibeus jamaicensis TaxID=9417 RepID=UPI00235B1965|nr:LOW QUALITY PROTEIN: putative cancer susceptibility gene HEPN1 protein [Artibeus jamaicensis]
MYPFSKCCTSHLPEQPTLCALPLDGGELELEFRRLRRGGMQVPPEAPGIRGQKTQKVSSFCFLVALSPHTVDYCLSYKLFHRRGHGQGLATQWPASLNSAVGVVRESALLLSLGISVSGSSAGRRQEAKGCLISSSCPGEQ